MGTTEDGVYEGTVQLQVKLSESIGHVVRFLGALRLNAEFRLLQVTGTDMELEISLGLRSPVRMREILTSDGRCVPGGPCSKARAGLP